mgnify:CR=1 FL=1
MSTTRRRFTKDFKLTVVREFTAGTSAAELIRKHDIHANLVYKWTQEYRLNPSGAFRSASDVQCEPGEVTRLAELERMIGRLTMENDFLKKALKYAETHTATTKQVSGDK